MHLISIIQSSSESSETINSVGSALDNNEKTIPEKINSKEKSDNSNKDEIYEHDFTIEKITECVIACKFNPNPDYVQIVANNIDNILVQERAMFLAQIIHESMGLTKIEEVKFTGNQMAKEYNTSLGRTGKSYHGRGFIQLTWPENYKAASERLGLKDLLLDEPELVCNNLELAWKVSEDYWLNSVSTHWLVKQKVFWATTFCINGFIECVPGKENEDAEKRWEYYEIVSEIMGEKNPACKGKDIMDKAILDEQKMKEKLETEEDEKIKQKEQAEVLNSNKIKEQNKKQEIDKDQDF